MANEKKYVYFFGGKKADGKADMKNLLGGKGANLAEMVNIGLPVPAGFTISTEVCTSYYDNKGKYPQELTKQVTEAIKKVEREMGRVFGDKDNPLLVSVRSGARASMPGMMDTVLNVGLNNSTRDGLINKTNNPRFVYDSQRRLIQMYSDVVMEKAAGIEPSEGKGVRHQLEKELHKMIERDGVKSETDLSPDALKELVEIYKTKVKEVLGKPFPEDAMEQLWGAVAAVFQSWNGKRAISYRRIENIPDWWGTAVNVQSMVFGNMGDTSATGVAFTRNPATGDNYFYGEWLPNAQGEDVVAGIRTPNPINEIGKDEHTRHLPSLETAMSEVYKDLHSIQHLLETHYHDMLDIEFTIQDQKLYMLQCRVGKRNGAAAVKMAFDMYREGLIKKEEAVMRVHPNQLDELLHPIIDPLVEKRTSPFVKGLPAGPGGASGQIVFTSAEAVEWTKNGKKVILVREETNPEDIEGMRAAQAILTARGGMTSHAALVARGWGKCCIVGAGECKVDVHTKTLSVNGFMLKEGDFISLNGSKGNVYEGELPMIKASPDNPNLIAFMKLCDDIRKLKVRTNAETPEDAAKAIAFGAEGIGLFRTEHMFYGKNAEIPLFLLRKMIVSKTEKERRAALDELFPYVKNDVKDTLEVMDGLPVTFRTLDPPLHEFVPNNVEERNKIADSLGVDAEEFNKRAEALHENNPMMGHRGVRLGITYPEITEMQVRAIYEATAELIQEGKNPFPEIMIPVTCIDTELKNQYVVLDKVYNEVLAKFNLKSFGHLHGTMIEIPRACTTADKIAAVAQFFSFGTNDLTQMTYGFSRDDIGTFLPEYLKESILPEDPFNILDQEGVGPLMKIAVEKGRSVRPELKIGICGEHGGEPTSVEFCHKLGFSYVSCSPFRVPIARLAAAHAVIKEKMAAKQIVIKEVTVKKPAKKVLVKKQVEKIVKKAMPKGRQVAAKRPIKKEVIKKVVKKVKVRKPVKKVVVKKPVKKAMPTGRQVTVKKVIKKVITKKPLKKVVAKKPEKKAAAKKPVKKGLKKIVKKTVRKKGRK